VTAGPQAEPYTSGPAVMAHRSSPPLFGERWTGPAEPPSETLLAAVAAAGLAVAVAVPTGLTGVGWLSAVAVVLATAFAVQWHAIDLDPARLLRPVTAPDVAWISATVALCAVGTVRAAEWLAALCLTAAAAAVSLAVAGRSFASLRVSLGALGLAALRALPWLRRGLDRDHRSLGRAYWVALASAAVLLVFVPLLTSADAAFSAVVDGLVPAFDGAALVGRLLLFGLGTSVTAGACFLLLAPPEPVDAPPRPTRLRCLDWAVPTGLLVGVFALFVCVQLAVLFGSAEYVVATTGLTYAEYARRGFWQLLAVTALALGVLAFDSRWAPDGTAQERTVKRGLLAALAALTLVVVASAIHRMWLYQQAYGFTVLRLLVLTCELWLGAGFLIALVAVLRLRPAGLSRSMVAAGMIALLGLAAVDPERLIAEHNLARWAQTGQLDTYYLGTLSADAVPTLVDLPEPDRSCVLLAIENRLAGPADWRGTNFSEESARAVLDRLDLVCSSGRP
jgi:hypothetical protein